MIKIFTPFYPSTLLEVTTEHHSELLDLDKPDQHPQSAIENLVEDLGDIRQSVVDNKLNISVKDNILCFVYGNEEMEGE